MGAESLSFESTGAGPEASPYAAPKHPENRGARKAAPRGDAVPSGTDFLPTEPVSHHLYNPCVTGPYNMNDIDDRRRSPTPGLARAGAATHLAIRDLSGPRSAPGKPDGLRVEVVYMYIFTRGRGTEGTRTTYSNMWWFPRATAKPLARLCCHPSPSRSLL
jgi:hypothetical protein